VKESTISLKQKHFKQVVDMSCEFKQWYNDAFGTEADRAMADRSRHDVHPNERRGSTRKGKEKKSKIYGENRGYSDDNDDL